LVNARSGKDQYRVQDFRAIVLVISVKEDAVGFYLSLSISLMALAD
jgi:hypothetical protein